MGGLLLLGVFLGWLAVAIWLARRISRHIKIKPSLRPVALFVLSILILFMPVADELAARPFFEA
ncbi:MAG TPA: hypothetical protein VKD22_09650, partial [Ramlibacter sp.]|nr:hypothetical protein [Ramlibacter sp.]